MNYQETVAYLYAQLPFYQNQGISAYKKNLDNILQLSEILGFPEKEFKSIHVGGTNGKGSVSSMLSAIFQTHHYKTGLYTSPHLKDFRERIRINGEMISEHEVVEFVKRVKPFIPIIKPSFFEITVAMAFDHFRRHHVDISIIEVGLGGRLDSTNIIQPEIAVVTNVGWDHMDLLGNTLAAIAYEKAGIIKKNTPVVIGEYSEDTRKVFEQVAVVQNAPLSFASKSFSAEIPESSLNGPYQKKNIVTVMHTLSVLEKVGYTFDSHKIHQALLNVQSLTGIMGRWQELGNKPKIIADTAHNEPGLRQVIPALVATPHEKLYIILGFVKDKNLKQILPLFPKHASYVFCKPSVMRGLPAQELFLTAKEFGLNGKVIEDAKEALESVKLEANENDVIYIGGSTFMVADVL